MVGSSKRRFRGPSVALLAAAMSWVLLGAQVAEAAPEPFSANFPIPVDAFVGVQATECLNTSTSIELGPSFTPLKGLNVSVKFRIPSDLAKKKQEITSTADLSIVKENGSFSAGKKGLNGAGGNPWILINFEGPNSNDWVVLGRCVQSGKKLNVGISKRIDLNALQNGVTAAVSCGNDKSQIASDARNQSGDKVNSWVMFTNQINKDWFDTSGVHHSDPEDGAANTQLTLLSGLDNVSKGGATGIGGNPLVSASFFTTDTVNGAVVRTYGTPSLEKRCKELMA